MSIEHIVALLIVERDRLSRAIEALKGSTKKRGRPPGSRNHKATSAPVKAKRTLSAAGRKAIADAAKKRWAAIKAGKASSPFAKLKKAKNVKNAPKA
jgi:hypothetical protein